MTNNIENYQPNVPKEIRKRYKKAKMRNFIGYLVCQWVHHSNYRSLNNGWFFIPASKLLEETGLSYHTVLNYESQLILDGMIEKKTGNFTDRKANEYRCTFMETATKENCNETKTSTKKTAPINCNEDSIDNEEFNEKTATMENEENCNTDTDIVSDTVHDNVYLNMVKSNLNNSNMEVKEHLVTESDSTYEEQFSSTVKNGKVKNVQSLGVGHCHFFKSVYERGVNEKLIENFAKLERKEQYDFLWSKWRTFMNGFSDSDISFGTVYDCFKTFLWMVGKVYNTPSKVKERKSALTHDFKLKLKAFYLNQWKRFLNMVDELDNDDCKKTRLAFYDMVVKVYDDDEERQKTLSQMEVEYAITYQATDKWSNPKPEELDPDLMYQNLSDGEVEETEVFGETQVTGETDGDASNRVYDKWYGVWRKLMKEVSNSNGKLTIDEHTTVAIMEKAEADELPYGWRQKLKEAMEEDLEQFNSKEDIAD